MSFKFSEFPIFKVSATGNDFLLFDLLSEPGRGHWQSQWTFRPRMDWVKRLCDRHFGLGADGAVFLEPATDADFRWDFYNSDGGTAEMCGNAARAVSLYMAETHGKREMKFETLAGFIRSKVHSARDIEVEMPEVKKAERGLRWARGEYDFVMSGVPHAVVHIDDLEPMRELRILALALKRETRFEKDGVNVTFVKRLSDGRIKSVTFERGVENFTLSCGTGAVAAAYAAQSGSSPRQLEVEVPGGTLSVLWKNNRPILKGPAEVCAKTHVNLNAEIEKEP